MAVKICDNCRAKVMLDISQCPTCGCSEFWYKCSRCGTIFKGRFCTECGLAAGTQPSVISTTMDQLTDEERGIKITTPTHARRNISISDIKLLYWLDGRKIKMNQYDQEHMQEKFGSLWEDQVKRLAAHGYITESTNAEAVQHMRVYELKQILIDNDIEPRGKKADLIKLILDNLDENALAPACGCNLLYTLTEAGSEIVQNNMAHIINEKFSYGFMDTQIVSVRAALLQRDSNYTEDDVILTLLLMDLKNAARSSKWFKYSIGCDYLYRYFLNKGDYHAALKYKCESLYMQLSGIMDNNYVNAIANPYVSGASIERISELLSKTTIPLEDFYRSFPSFISIADKLPFAYYRPDQVAVITVRMLRGIPFQEASSDMKRATPSEEEPSYYYRESIKTEIEEQISTDGSITSWLKTILSK